MLRRRMAQLATALTVVAIITGGADGMTVGYPASAAPSIRLPSADPTPTSPPPSVLPISPAAQAKGFVDVRTAVPDALVELRYATAHNFVGVALYPPNARCLVHRSMVAGLRTAAAALRRSHEVLVFWDCYRPHSVQQKMYETVANPAWVAAPGPYSRSHESGRSVDVTVAAQRNRRLIDMGTGFDSFTPQASAYATAGVSAAAQRNRARLRAVMGMGHLAVYSGEWWHFDGAGAGAHRPIIDVPPL